VDFWKVVVDIVDTSCQTIIHIEIADLKYKHLQTLRHVWPLHHEISSGRQMCSCGVNAKVRIGLM
jgi:hypothetical protein